MIAEWARLVSLEAEAGRSGASWGLALAWHREGGPAGFCDDVTVYVTGEATVSSCVCPFSCLTAAADAGYNAPQPLPPG